MFIGGYDCSSSSSMDTTEVLFSLEEPMCPGIKLPGTRDGHSVVTTPDGLHLVCGGTAKAEDRKSCIKFNTATLKWEDHSNTLDPTTFITAAVSLDSGTYLLGGSDDTKKSEFLAKGDTVWTSGPTLEIEVLDGCAVRLNPTEFVLFPGEHSKKVLKYNSDTKQFTTDWDELPQIMTGPGCIMTNNGVLVAGGSGSTVARLYDPITGKAKEVGPLAKPRHDPTLVQFEDKVLMVGGYNHDIKICEDSIEEWDPVKETWSNSLLTKITGSNAAYAFTVTGVEASDLCTN